MTSSDISLLHQVLNKQLIYSHVIVQLIFQLTLSLCSSGSQGMAEAKRPMEMCRRFHMTLTNGTSGLQLDTSHLRAALTSRSQVVWPREPSVVW